LHPFAELLPSADGDDVAHDGSIIRIGRLAPVLAHVAKALGVALRLQTESPS
jgi:hypothetical protein